MNILSEGSLYCHTLAYFLFMGTFMLAALGTSVIIGGIAAFALVKSGGTIEYRIIL
jgi:predicted phage tail protein